METNTNGRLLHLQGKKKYEDWADWSEEVNHCGDCWSCPDLPICDLKHYENKLREKQTKEKK